MYLQEPGALKYREIDMGVNDGHLPQKTTLYDNICFCLVKPTYDQCADPTYTQWRANLPVWNKHRALWHKGGGNCASSCACSSAWFHSISLLDKDLHEGMLCQPVLLTCSKYLLRGLVT